jgi:hypothetical protein
VAIKGYYRANECGDVREIPCDGLLLRATDDDRKQVQPENVSDHENIPYNSNSNSMTAFASNEMMERGEPKTWESGVTFFPRR